MIVQFSVKNYKSFKDKCTFSMVASNYDKDTNESSNVIQLDNFNLRLLKSGVIYGANASGKSKFIDALVFFRKFILNSSRLGQTDDYIQTMEFVLAGETFGKSSEFEIIFIIADVTYRYGFELQHNGVVSEWLYAKQSKLKSKDNELYYRENQEIEANDKVLPKVKTLIKEDLVRSNALLLSVLAQFNDGVGTLLIDYFSKINIVSGLNEASFKSNSINKIKNSTQKDKVLELLKGADLGIVDVEFREQPSFMTDDNIPSDVRKKLERIDLSSVVTQHNLYTSGKLTDISVFFNMNDESHGTQKFFYFSGLIIDALENGTALIVDELDSKLHPNLVCKIVSLFNSKESNPKNAQLIFNTHDTNLLSSGLFRRDQIWFVSKDTYGASKMYSLADFKTTEVRKNEPFEDNYIKGKYGAVPYLGDFDELINKIVSEDGKAE